MKTPPEKRRSRNALAFAVLSLLALQLAMSCGINSRKLEWADAEYGTTIRNLVARKKEFPDRPLLAVLGSSRSRNAFAADRLSEPIPGDEHPPLVYDACLVGAHPIHYLIMLRRMLAIGIRPAAVSIEILPAHIRSYNGAGTDPVTLPLVPKTEAIRLRPGDLEMVNRYGSDRGWMWSRRWVEAQIAPWSTYRLPLTSRYAPSWAPKEDIANLNNWTRAIGPFGWSPIRLQWVPEELARSAGKVAEEGYRPYLNFTAAHPTYDTMLRDLLILCREEKIAVLGLVIMPESSTFRSWYPPATQRFIRQYAGGVAADFGVPLIDANEWVPDKYFLDGHHMIEPGAVLFSDRFRTEVIRPWMRNCEQR